MQIGFFPFHNHSKTYYNFFILGSSRDPHLYVRNNFVIYFLIVTLKQWSIYNMYFEAEKFKSMYKLGHIQRVI